MNYLLDTNVISDLVAKKPNERVVNWIDALEPSHLYLSSVTIGEIRKDIEKVIAPERKLRLHTWLVDDLLIRFEDRILSLGTEEMMSWGVMVGQAKGSGRIISAMDSLIAALSLHHNCTLATRNVNHFTGLGIRLVNPWDE